MIYDSIAHGWTPNEVEYEAKLRAYERAHKAWMESSIFDHEEARNCVADALIVASPAMYDALMVAAATIIRLERHAPGSAKGTLDVIRAALAEAS